MKTSRLAAATAGMAALALTLSACGSTPETSTGTEGQSGSTGGSDAAPVDFKACMVAGVGGLDDKSFNQSGYEGLKRAEAELGVEIAVSETFTVADYVPQIGNMVSEGCDLVFGVSWDASEAIHAAAEAHPDILFGLIDEVSDPEIENAKGLVFNTAEATYLAGYAAAAMTETGKVGTFLGGKMPPTMLFADGFADGVSKYNEVNGADVELVGWNKADQDGMATGDFEDISRGKQFSIQLIEQGVDIIMPVAGSVSTGALAAAREHPGTSVVWVDVDGFYSEPDYSDLMLTSVLKEIGNAVYDTISEAVDGNWTGADYIGSLENNGVGLAPWHDFEDKIPADLDDALGALREQIISGEILVESPSAPR
ncbi:BMP family lipoprotein [Actinomyces minihominis]|uniref:BMP family lipoprotein n=1 Tax=Actinomyces minihominis TaxID=2002838 RepID=UPI000C07E15E|nr:BMP family ABC transporter substrate-binding protein [Actinomyces minihominis]